MNIDALLEKLSGMKVMVVGDVMIDSYLWGKITRISPEAPVPVVDVQGREKRLGGAANVAKNIKALGGECALCTIIGDDEQGKDFFKLLSQDKIRTNGVITSSQRPTTIKHRVLSGSQQILRVDEESKEDLTSEENNKLLHAVLEDIENVDVVILQDYDKGVLNVNNIERIIEIAHQHKKMVVVDPKKLHFDCYKKVDLFKPNLKEISDGLNRKVGHDKESVRAAVADLKSKLNLENVLVTLSEHGVFMDMGGAQHLIPTDVMSVADVSGAGDTVIAIVAMAFATGLEPEKLGKLANIAGGLVCEELGVVPIDKEKLRTRAVDF